MPINDLSDLRLAAGLSINIELPDADNKRYKGTLIGLVPDRSVLISTPMLGGGRPLLLRKEQTLICRFFSHKVAGAFSAKILHLCTNPIRYMHLGWPREIEVDMIRSSERVIANLNVSVVNQSNSLHQRSDGILVDLSTTGARLECIDPIGSVGDVILVSGHVVVGHVIRLISIEATIKSELDRFYAPNSSAAYGIEFTFVSDVDFLALQAFVSAQLTKGAEL